MVREEVGYRTERQEMKEARLSVEVELTEEMLGTASANPDLHKQFVASKAPGADKDAKMEEEIGSLGVDKFIERSMTVFSRNQDGKPIMWDYQVKGFFKDACSLLAKMPDTKSKDIKAFRKIIDGAIFVEPRQIELILPKDSDTGRCERPLRAQTPQGERVALANSESVPAGTKMRFDVVMLDPKLEEQVREWLDYGKRRGFGQWRNSGKGRMIWKEAKT